MRLVSPAGDSVIVSSKGAKKLLEQGYTDPNAPVKPAKKAAVKPVPVEPEPGSDE